jgi:hypothetical protein
MKGILVGVILSGLVMLFAVAQSPTPEPSAKSQADVAGEIGNGVTERHGPVRMEDRHDRTVDERDPVGDLADVGAGLGVGDGHLVYLLR